MLRIFWPNLISKEDFSERCETEPMATILMTRRRRWIVHVTRRETSIAKTALHWIPEEKCKRHNPKNTWRRTVEKSEFCFRFLFPFFFFNYNFYLLFPLCILFLWNYLIVALYFFLVYGLSTFQFLFSSFSILSFTSLSAFYFYPFLSSFLSFFFSFFFCFWAVIFLGLFVYSCFFFFFLIVVIFSFIHS